MAKANITQYSSTPSSNTDINNINIDENCPASGLNNAIRELMAHLKNVDTGSQALTALSVTGDTTISSGNLLVGKTSASLSTTGIYVLNGGATGITRSASTPLAINRLSNDGGLIDFYKDTTTVGSIDSRGGVALTINSQGGNGRLGQGGTTYYEWNTTRFAPVTDTVGDLGRGANRWKDLYLSGGVYLGGTGSANYLDDYEEGSHTITFPNSSASPSGAGAVYTKIGSVVNYVGSFTFPSSSDSTAVNISIPFTSASNNSLGQIFTNGVTNKVLFTGGAGTNYMRIYPDNSFGTNSYADLSGVAIYFTITYRTSA